MSLHWGKPKVARFSSVPRDHVGLPSCPVTKETLLLQKGEDGAKHFSCLAFGSDSSTQRMPIRKPKGLGGHSSLRRSPWKAETSRREKSTIGMVETPFKRCALIGERSFILVWGGGVGGDVCVC